MPFSACQLNGLKPQILLCVWLLIVSVFGSIVSFTYETGSYCTPDCKIWTTGASIRYLAALLLVVFIEAYSNNVIRFQGNMTTLFKIQELLDVFGVIWFTIGNLLVFSSSGSCSVSQPICFSTVIVIISSLYIYYIGPLLYKFFRNILRIRRQTPFERESGVHRMDFDGHTLSTARTTEMSTADETYWIKWLESKGCFAYKTKINQAGQDPQGKKTVSSISAQSGKIMAFTNELVKYSSTHQQCPICLDPLTRIQPRRSNSYDNTASCIIDCNRSIDDVNMVSISECSNDALPSGHGSRAETSYKYASPSIDSNEGNETTSVSQADGTSSVGSTHIHEPVAFSRDTCTPSERASGGCMPDCTFRQFRSPRSIADMYSPRTVRSESDSKGENRQLDSTHRHSNAENNGSSTHGLTARAMLSRDSQDDLGNVLNDSEHDFSAVSTGDNQQPAAGGEDRPAVPATVPPMGIINTIRDLNIDRSSNLYTHIDNNRNNSNSTNITETDLSPEISNQPNSQFDEDLTVCFPCSARHEFHRSCLLHWLHTSTVGNRIRAPYRISGYNPDSTVTCPCCRQHGVSLEVIGNSTGNDAVSVTVDFTDNSSVGHH